ncbi:MAG: ROK family protein [Firmicutes bacterium]|nr:ROK family protein [Bacillota bacterium]
MKLIPAIKNYIWGGTKLKEKFGKVSDSPTIAETWEFSIHPDGVATTEDGKPLSQILPDLGFLVKLIDAADNLSVQVHPDDTYAANVGSLGKREMWYIIDAEPGAGIYCGFKRDMTKSKLRTALTNGTILDDLNFFEVKAGDCFFIEAGVVHAIGKGVTLYELQQSSNLTYRLYDYGRVGADGKPRELHIEDALKVADLTKYVRADSKIKAGNGIQRLSGCKSFTAYEITTKNQMTLKGDPNSFAALTVIEGKNAGQTTFVQVGQDIELQEDSKIIMAKMIKYYLGIDIGGTQIKGGIVSSDGLVLSQGSIATDAQKLSSCVSSFGEELLAKAGLKKVDIEAIGMGIPGIIDSEAGIITYSNNLAIKHIPIVKEVVKAWGKDVPPIFISNDANVAALGECKFGAGKKYNSLVMVTLGTGVGSGIVIDGKIFEGNKGAGAEVGHMVIERDGEPCNCGRKGCFEVYSSANALKRDILRALEAHKDSKMWEGVKDKDKVGGKLAFDYRHTDPIAKKVVDNYIDYLADGLTNVATIFRPDAIVIGGGVSAQGENLLKDLRVILNNRIFGQELGPKVELVTAKLGNDAGFLGAAALAMSKME